jgi:hypothetical protein
MKSRKFYLNKFFVVGLKNSEQALMLCARSACIVMNNALGGAFLG